MKFTPEEIAEIKQIIRGLEPDTLIQNRDQINSGILLPRIYFDSDDTQVTTASTTYDDADTGTTGPSITLPYAGTYEVEVKAAMYQVGGGLGYMSFDIGAVSAVDDNSISQGSTATGLYISTSRIITVLGRTTLTAKYRTTSNTLAAFGRILKAQQVLVQD